MTINAKKKGNKGENRFANWLKFKGVAKASRNPSSGGNTNKSDVINDIGINFEVKTVKRIGLQEAWKQSDRDAKMSGAETMLAIHFDGMPQDEWLMVMHSEDWADLFKRGKEPKLAEHTESREEKYKIQRAITSLKEVIKIYEI